MASVFRIQCLVFLAASFLVICHQTLSFSSNKQKIIHISPSGFDAPDCGYVLNACRTLFHVFTTDRDLNDTTLQIRGTLQLNESYSLENLHNFRIAGNRDNKLEMSQIQCAENTGLFIKNSRHIDLMGFVMKSCGSKWLDCNKNTTHIAALYFNNCSAVRLFSLHMIQSVGRAVVMEDGVDEVIFQDCVFTNIVNYHDGFVNLISSQLAGGGVYLRQTKNASRHKRLSLDGRSYHNNFKFINCCFKSNKFQRFLRNNITHFEAANRGGGLAVLFEGEASSNTIEIITSQFSKNKAYYGGGLYVHFGYSTTNNNVLIRKCRFEENQAKTEGGAVFINFENVLNYRKTLSPTQQFIFQNCRFENNTSMSGGALFMYGTSNFEWFTLPSTKHYFLIKFEKCLWLRNVARSGSAISAFYSSHGELGPHVLMLQDCNISNNVITTITKDQLIVGQGAVFTSVVPIILSGETIFSNNKDTALALESAKAEINDKVRFEKNTGPAVSMYGNSKFVLKENSSLVFQENTCSDPGSALYVSAPSIPFASLSANARNTDNCFFIYEKPGVSYDDWNTKIEFCGNDAPAVFATTLMNCAVGRQERSDGHNRILEWPFVKFFYKNGSISNVTREVSTDPVHITYSKTDWDVSPGQIFSPRVALLNEKRQVVDGAVHVTIHFNQTKKHHIFQSKQGHISRLSINGKEHEQFSVTLKSIKGAIVKVRINNLKLKRCNDGFLWSKRRNRCVCADKQNSGISRCNEEGTKVFIKIGYWAGHAEKTTLFATYPCPYKYCNCSTDKDTNLDFECLYKKEQMCHKTRDINSVLCGECKTNYTAVIGNYFCINMMDERCQSLTIHILILIGIGVAVFLFVVLILIFDVDIFTGHLNCFFYFYQVLPCFINRNDIQTPPKFHRVRNFINFFVYLSNLQVFTGNVLKICPGPFKFDNADKLMLQYIIPLYAITSVVLMAKCIKRYPGCFYRRRNVKQASPLRALCTTLVLCYSIITYISMELLHPVKISGKFYLYQDGGLKFFEGKHLLYGLVAIFLMVTVVILVPFFLIFTPACNKIVARRVGNLMPFYDPLQSCFKNQYRKFSAFYFICRFLVLATAVWVPENYIYVKKAFLSTLSVFSLGIFLYFKPYKESKQKEDENDLEDSHPKQRCHSLLFAHNSYDWLNTSDAILLTNLSVISVFCAQIPDERGEHVQEMSDVIWAVIYSLACLPLFLLLLVVARALYWRCLYENKCSWCGKIVSNKLKKKTVPLQSLRNTIHLEQSPIPTWVSKNYGSANTYTFPRNVSVSH